MTLTVARDLSSEAIRVNTILPGIFDTPSAARRAPAHSGRAVRRCLSPSGSACH